jgi:signal transduction histidine kinase
LHPGTLDKLGLAAAIGKLVDDYRLHHEINIEAHVQGLDNVSRLDTTVERTVYRGAQELLTNISKHADAENVSLLIDRSNRYIRLTIDDDGRGFESLNGSHPTPSSGLGLFGIRERVEQLRGQFVAESTPGQGSTFAIEIPIEEHK